MDRRKQQSNRARERRLRAKYRRNIRIAVVVTLVIGLAGGFLLGRYTAPKSVPTAANLPSVTPTPEASASADPDNSLSLDATPTADAATPEPTSEATPTTAPTDTPLPTVTPTLVPTAVPEPEAIEVPVGEAQDFSVQVYSDGTVRRADDDQPYETLNFSLQVLRYLNSDYYQETYGSSYRLQGNEAGVEFELTLNDYIGDLEIVPQGLFSVTLENAGGIVEQGYQLTDAEIQGNPVSIQTNIPTLVYKRFIYSESVGDMKYLCITAYHDGVAQKYRFELDEPVAEPTASPTPAATYPALENGSKGDDVAKLQQRLIDLGYLDGAADGLFGSKTETAIRAAQGDFGMTENGVADDAFQQRLFADGN